MPGEPLGTTPRFLAGGVREQHRPDPERWWDDLLTRSTRAPAFRMVRDGATLPRSQLCRSAGVGHQHLDDLIEPNRVLEAYGKGASLVLQGLQHTDRAMGQWSTNLALELNQPVQLNAYLSPAAARGLDLHFDYHDVIVVQLAGTKAWRIWEPLDRSRLPQKRGPGIPKPEWAEMGEPLIEVTVQPGDVLVIPRGHPHAAATVDDESVHLTIGIMSLSWQALLSQQLRNVAGGRALAATADTATPGFDSAPAGLAKAIESLTVDFDAATLARAHRLEVWRRQPRTRLRPRGATFDPTADQRVTAGPLLWLDDATDDASGDSTAQTHAAGSSVRLQLGDRALTFPGPAAPLLKLVLNERGSFSIGSLTASAAADGLDAASVRAILTALHQEGVVAHGPL